MSVHTNEPIPLLPRWPGRGCRRGYVYPITSPVDSIELFRTYYYYYTLHPWYHSGVHTYHYMHYIHMLYNSNKPIINSLPLYRILPPLHTRHPLRQPRLPGLARSLGWNHHPRNRLYRPSIPNSFIFLQSGGDDWCWCVSFSLLSLSGSCKKHNPN